MKHKLLRIILYFSILTALCYGAGRLYFKVTGGFQIANITSDFAYNPLWETRTLSVEEQSKVDSILSQHFTYLAKGCQSYVFLSDDGKYVLKFFKYQRFRPQFYIDWFSFIPFVETIKQEKIEKKQRKLNDLFASWKVAFNELPEETGLVYVHLNKSHNLQKTIHITDKIGMKQELDLDQMEFLVQERAEMLCQTLDRMMAKKQEQEAKDLLSKLVVMIVSEYHRGYADNDHALMQNTGVFDGKPIHIDVGQFVKSQTAQNPAFYHQELFNKMWKFREWLKKYPTLLSHLDSELYKVMGDDFHRIHFIPKVR